MPTLRRSTERAGRVGRRYSEDVGAHEIVISADDRPGREELVELYDAVGWTSYTTDPDVLVAALAGAVKTFGGHVDKLTGDGIMAVFGAPVAHEDDAERAVRAALSMQRAVRRVLDDERGGGAPTGLRVGLNTGEVVAGRTAAARGELVVSGDVVNVAARLQQHAAAGEVLVGARTRLASA